MNSRNLAAAGAFALIAGAASASAQPAYAPTPYELIRADGARVEERLEQSREVALTPRGVTLGRRLQDQPRSGFRMICNGVCPKGQLGKRAAHDVIHWRDGRKTSGFAVVFENIVEQNGRRVGRFEDVTHVELGSVPAPAKLVASYDIGQIRYNGFDRKDWGSYYVFHRPWLELTETTFRFDGKDARPRSQARFFTLEGHEFHISLPRVKQDTIGWKDGAVTEGRVLVRNDMVIQTGRKPRSLRDAKWIHLAPAPDSPKG